jgi:hypothetical protein
MPEDLSRFCCLNEDCPDFGKRGIDNLTVCARYGKDRRRRMLYCRTCKTRFSGGVPVELNEAHDLSSRQGLATLNLC